MITLFIFLVGLCSLSVEIHFDDWCSLILYNEGYYTEKGPYACTRRVESDYEKKKWEEFFFASGATQSKIKKLQNKREKRKERN